MKDSKILITGANGLLGPHLAAAFSKLGVVVGLGRSTGTVLCDLTDAKTTKDAVSKVDPDLTVHCAGLTDVDLCEANPVEADRQNRLATANLVAALPRNSRLVFISTDQVYPDLPGPHEEGSENPVNHYGQSKLAGESVALEHGNSVAVRTNMFGPSLRSGRQSLSDFVIDNLSANRSITLFRDLMFSPLHFDTLAQCLQQLAQSNYMGTCNLGSRDGLTKAEFGLAVAVSKNLPLNGITIGHSETIHGRAPRARDLRMDVSRIEQILGSQMPGSLEEIGRL